MTSDSGARRRRTSVLLSVLLAIGATALQPAIQVAGPAPVAHAADPSPVPTGPLAATPDPSSVPTPAPTDVPSPVPTSAPTPDPSPGSPTAATDPPTSTATNVPAVPSAPATPPSSPVPTLLKYSLSTGQQPGSDAPAAFPVYQLVAPSAPNGDTPHHPSSGLDGVACASCHSSHTALGSGITKAASPSSLCFGCHSSGSTFDVQTQFTGIPANDDATASYYSHPVSASSALQHEVGTDDEFSGRLNRHAVCADCHNPHDADGTRPQLSTTGWTASGDVRAASGVSVTNSAPGSAPRYTLLARSQGRSLTYEYELCLKCHSGSTTLPTRSASNPSWWALDKGIELNPANNSYHPVEAGGKNVSAQMAGSLAGTSPFKAWNFAVDSTIRCTHCHGDPTTVNQSPSATPLAPSGDSYEASHASPNRGILTAPYRDRILKALNEPYSAQDFALCYLCHAERPFVDPNNTTNATDTAFPAHGLHLTQIAGVPGSGSSIDQSGAGEGLAICSECHFRIHSTAEAFAAGDAAPFARATGNSGLVGFAPNVTAVGFVAPKWTPPNAQGQGSCTLTCHGFTHSTTSYNTAPGTGFTAAVTTGPLGPAGFSVQFLDQTRYISATAARWTWDFGDGGTSTSQNPTHTYVYAGTFNVSLTVRRTSGNTQPMTMTKTAFITVTP